MPLTYDDISYSTGTADLTATNATVAASGAALWDGIKPGDLFSAQGYVAVIAAINDDFDELTLDKAWPGTTATGVDYTILKASPARPTLAEIGAAWEAIRVAMQGQGFIWNVAEPRTVPDPSWGKDGDFAFKLDGGAFKVWDRTGGAWVLRDALVPDASITPAKLDAGSAAKRAAFMAALGAREVIAGNRMYFVRIDGDDANDGLTDSSGGAFATVQKAQDVVCSLDMGIYQVTIQIVDSTAYTAGATLGRYVGLLAPIIQGNSGTPASVTITTTSGFTNDGGPTWIIRNLKLVCSGGVALYALNQGVIKFSGIDFGAANVHIRPTLGGVIQAIGNYTISGAAAEHVFVDALGICGLVSVTCTLSGALAFDYFVLASSMGLITAGGASFTGGTITGQRFFVFRLSMINTEGGGVNVFPGDAAGTADAASFGYYI